MSSTSPVTAAPVPLMAWERRMARRSAGVGRAAASSSRQCRTIPVCDSVNEVKTPTM